MFWVHRLDSNAEKGEINKIFFNAWLFPQLTCLAVNGFPAFILMFLGGDFFTELLGRIPESFVNALSVTGNILPAVGVAMLLNYLGKKKVAKIREEAKAAGKEPDLKKLLYVHFTMDDNLSLSEEITMLRKRVKEQDKEIRRLKEENEFLEEASAFFARG